MAKVFVSSVIDAPADTVWQIVRDFNSLSAWHPAIRDSEIEGGRASDSVGCVRSLSLEDGGHIREQLRGLSDEQRSMDYVILQSPMPVRHYAAALRILPITDGDASYVQWTAEFDVAADRPEDAVKLVRDGVFQRGIDGLKKKLGGG